MDKILSGDLSSSLASLEHDFSVLRVSVKNTMDYRNGWVLVGPPGPGPAAVRTYEAQFLCQLNKNNAGSKLTPSYPAEDVHRVAVSPQAK